MENMDLFVDSDKVRIENKMKEYEDNGFNPYQVEQLYKGLSDDLDITIYDDISLNHYQMYQIRLGLLSKVDVSLYNKAEYNSSQMEAIRVGLEAGLDVSSFLDKNLSRKEMISIREKLQKAKKLKLHNDSLNSQLLYLLVKKLLQDNSISCDIRDSKFIRKKEVIIYYLIYNKPRVNFDCTDIKLLSNLDKISSVDITLDEDSNCITLKIL